MLSTRFSLLLLLFCSFVVLCSGDCPVNTTPEKRTNQNCAWYNSDSCCTSAVISLLNTKQGGAARQIPSGKYCRTINTACTNAYLLFSCGLFCSPEHSTWLQNASTGEVRICASFAKSLYDACSSQQLTDLYENVPNALDSCKDVSEVYADAEAMAAGLSMVYATDNTNCYNSANSLPVSPLALAISLFYFCFRFFRSF